MTKCGLTEIDIEKSFITVHVSNFKDSICNLIYDYQKYLNMFYGNIKNLYTTMAQNDIISTSNKEVISFAVNESENILNNKTIAFAISAHHLVERKYAELRSSILKHENIKFYICPRAYEYLKTLLSKMDIDALALNIYDSKFKNELYDFKEYAMNKRQSISNMKFEIDYTTSLNSMQLLIILDKSCDQILKTFREIITLAEETNDLNTSLNIVRIAIELLVIVFSIVMLIDVDDKEEDYHEEVKCN